MRRVLATLALATTTTLGAATAAQAAALPPGVVALGPDDPCPPRALCVYENWGFGGHAYAVRQGYRVDLHELPCDGCRNGSTMANNASSWNNRATMTARLVKNDGTPAYVYPGQRIESGSGVHDNVVSISWVP